MQKTIIICGLADIQNCVDKYSPDKMLTIINQNFSPDTPKGMDENRHLKMLIDDISEPREGFGDGLKTWLGDSHGRWEGDTLVVEVRNLNGRTSYLGSSPEMKLTQRFTRTGPNTLRYEFTVDDPAVWTEPWTGMFNFIKDDNQIELVEYACHEGNYSMPGILAGARRAEREQASN